MYKYFEWQIIKSFLKRKQGDMAYSIISLLSLLGISLAVAVIITVMSVMNGFQVEIQEKMLNLIPHATIKNINNKANVDLLNAILDNKQFVSNAPENIVTHEQNKRNRYENELRILQNNLNSLK